MEFGAAFPVQPDAPEDVQPGEGALDCPAQPSQAGAVLWGAPGDDGLDATRRELAPVLVEVVAAVGDQRVGAQAGAPDLAGDRADAVDERQQLGDVVAVAARQLDGQRDPGAVDDQLVLGARSATVNRGDGPMRPP
jgi:hypothetical protein